VRLSTRLTLTGAVSVTVVALIGAVLASTTRTVRRELTRNEAGKGVDRGCQHVDAVGGLGVLMHAVAEAKLIDPLGDLEQGGGERRRLRE